MTNKQAFSDAEIRALAFLAAQAFVKGPQTNMQQWRSERAAKDLRSIPWGSFGHCWAVYNEAFAEAVEQLAR